MNYSIIYSPESLDDLRSIYSYIAFSLKAPDTAKNQIDRIRDAIKNLNFSPEAYVQVEWDPWKSMGMRKLPVNNYLVFYNVNHEELTVSIVRIMYAGRDVKSIIRNEI